MTESVTPQVGGSIFFVRGHVADRETPSDRERRERAERLFDALKTLERSLGHDVSWEELGRMVADAEDGRGEPYSASVVRRWFKALADPGPLTWRAIAAVTGYRAGWLYLAELPKYDTSGRAVDPTTGRLPDEEIAVDDDEAAMLRTRPRQRKGDRRRRPA